MNYFNYERELCVALMIGGPTPDAIDVMGKIRPEMISGYLFEVYQAILDLYSKGLEFTPLAIEEKTSLDLDTIVTMCKSTAGHPSNIKAYAKRVRQGYLLKTASDRLSSVIREIDNCSDESQIGEISERLESVVSSLMIETDDKKPRQASEILEQYLEIVDQRCSGAEEQRRLKVGINVIDDITQGFNLTDLILIAGAPGMGKTELMMAMVNGAADENKGPLVFSMEMDEYQLIERSIALESGLPISCARSPLGMQDHEWAKFSEGMGRVKNKKYFVLDQAGLGVNEICAAATRHKMEFPETNLICIDYVGLIRLQKADRHDIAVGEVSRRLKQLAKEIKTPVILLSQITSKEVEKRPDKRPLPSDLKDSSRLQDDADWIIFPYRDEVYYPDSPRAGLAEVIFGKARHGSKKTGYMSFINGHFTEIDQDAAVLEIAKKTQVEESESHKRNSHKKNF